MFCWIVLCLWCWGFNQVLFIYSRQALHNGRQHCIRCKNKKKIQKKEKTLRNNLSFSWCAFHLWRILNCHVWYTLIFRERFFWIVVKFLMLKHEFYYFRPCFKYIDLVCRHCLGTFSSYKADRTAFPIPLSSPGVCSNLNFSSGSQVSQADLKDQVWPWILNLPSVGITGVCHYALFLCWDLSPCELDKCFTNWAVPLPLIFLVLFSSMVWK